MTTPIAMTTDPEAVVLLAQWLSPSFPIGAFSYSHGLEATVLSGVVKDAPTLEKWLSGVLEHGAGANDLIFLRAAHAAPDEAALAEINALALALVPSRERLLETSQQGASFCLTVNAVWGGDLPDLALPVAVGAAAARQGLPVDLTARLYLHAFASALTSAAIRLVPLGQTDGQRVLKALLPLIGRLTDASEGKTLDDLGSCAFLADIAAMTHETQYSRLFRS
jgi:urease accessory protein